MSANPLLNDSELPAFDKILPEHVEPALTQILEENRARIAMLEALPAPTFATLIVPL
jgi:oligopeptidase A